MILIFLEFIFNFCFLTTLFISNIILTLPDAKKAQEMRRTIFIKIYDRNNELIAKYGSLQENNIDIYDIPKHLTFAITSIEDKNFFKHKGIDFLAILRSAFINLRYMKGIAGGSSITQQLAKNILQNEEKITTKDRTIIRKIKELFLTFKIEKTYKKHQILAFYLNRVYFGSNCFGIYSASKEFFNKEPKDLNLYEAAALVGVLKAPSKITNNEDIWKKRAKKVLQCMLKNKYITQKELDEFENFHFKKAEYNKQSFLKYFADFVIANIPSEITSDLIIKTTLDKKVQENCHIAVNSAFEEAGLDWNAQQGAMVVINKKGEVLAIIGGLNYNESEFNRATSAQRSTGSFFKFYIYLEAIKQGLDINSLVIDTPYEIGSWNPSNYLHKTKKEVSVKYAFATSVNSVAIRLLLAVQPKNVINLLKELGIKSEIKPYLSMALGGFSGNLLELTNSLTCIINNGIQTEAFCITEIYDAKTNKLLYKNKPNSKKILEKKAVWYMWQLMKETTSFYGTGRRINTNKKTVGGKTGTSNDYKDLLFIGATPEYTFGIWFGRDDFKKMNMVFGKNLAILATSKFLELMPECEKEIDTTIKIDEKNTKTIYDLNIMM